VQITIFYMDMRATGKGFQEFVSRAKDSYGVKYVRTRPAKIQSTNGESGVLMSYETRGLAGEPVSEEFDLLVLCPALKPAKDNYSLTKILGAELDTDGFFVTPRLAYPTDTTEYGVLVCGFASGPIDIPDSVSQASAVAARVAEIVEGGRT